MCGCDSGCVDVVCLLLDMGANINKVTQCGDTPLRFACGNGHVGVVEVLIDKGAHINAYSSSDGKTPLLCASASGHVEVVKLLLVKGADVNAKDKKGRTAIKWARNKGYRAVADVLAASGGIYA
eukprot:GHVR01012389.1.p1 GENE.GHVR01012389.1~~GHVR01012389.1.p1  ORF type:complete len:124 (+),score=25.07 GHVR01012389.1:341-712(+)